MTKKTAENLSEYLNDINLKVHYLHSEIDAIETSESLDALAYQFVLEEGTDSGTNYLLTEDGDFIVSESYNVDTIDTSADNTFFETQGDSILDFTEFNPFGEVT